MCPTSKRQEHTPRQNRRTHVRRPARAYRIIIKLSRERGSLTRGTSRHANHNNPTKKDAAKKTASFYNTRNRSKKGEGGLRVSDSRQAVASLAAETIARRRQLRSKYTSGETNSSISGVIAARTQLTARAESCRDPFFRLSLPERTGTETGTPPPSPNQRRRGAVSSSPLLQRSVLSLAVRPLLPFSLFRRAPPTITTTPKLSSADTRCAGGSPGRNPSSPNLCARGAAPDVQFRN